MEFKSYCSSSAGNLYELTDSAGASILLECGVSHRKLRKLTGFRSDYQGCLVTHSHQDHGKAAKQLMLDGMELYMSHGTAMELGLEHVNIVKHNDEFAVGDFLIKAFNVYHDTDEPLGWLIRSKVDGDILVFATDTVNLRYKFPGINLLAIEANYDKDLLAEREHVPDKVRHRVTNTHMEISVLCDYLRTLDLSNCREVYLLHLSDGQSNARDFEERVRKCVPEHTRVTVCPKENKK